MYLFELVADDLCGPVTGSRATSAMERISPRGSAGLSWRRGRGMSGSGGQRDKAAVCGVPVCWPWVPMSGGRLGSSRLASSGVLPVGEGGGDEACAIPGAQFDGLVAEELRRCRWLRRRRWIRTVGRARPRGFRGRQAGRQGAGLRAADSAATIGQGSPGCSFLARARLFPWQSQGVMMALGDQYLAMQGQRGGERMSAWWSCGWSRCWAPGLAG